ncbi:MAG: penicillin-binding protein 2 [Candidatus Omnitrophica bacterium]|nr:penicillin-binding protein 2 [Candidatus Omnitrophota bacterium]
MATHVSARRFWLIQGGVSLLFLIIGYQLIQLTWIRQPALNEVAEKQHNLTVVIPPLRGAILDRKGRELATNLKIPSIYAVPRAFDKESRERLAGPIADALRLRREYVLERLSRNKAFVWLKRKVSVQEAAKIKALGHPALGIIEEYRRFYPQGDLLSQVLGFSNIDNQGIEGIELSLNKDLQGREGRRFTRRDALGREVRAFDAKTIPAQDGNRIVLTIDQYLQYLTERSLEAAYKQWKAKGAMAIIMNPKTGEILAMANRPGFDPNEYEKSNTESRRNRAVTDMYEPGSVFKIVASSGVLQEKLATVDKIFFCENGRYRYGSRTLRDVHGYGNLTLAEVIVKSSNIGTVKMAALMKPEVFQRYIQNYGFGRSTGIDIHGEAPGFTRPPSQWSNTSPYNIPMGHEIMVTALQMVRAFAVVANGGELMKPYMVSRIEDPHGIVLRENKPVALKRVISPEVAGEMRKMLVRVVNEGTGKSARIEGISVGGKTGTAQKVLPGGRGYSHDSFISSFIGFAPSEGAQMVMAVVLDDPRGKYYGGTVAGPVFKEVVEAGLLYLGHIPENAAQLSDNLGAPSLPNGQGNQPKLLQVQSTGRGV